MTCPANRTVLLLHCPISNAPAVEDMSAFQHNRFLGIEALQADGAGNIFTLHNE